MSSRFKLLLPEALWSSTCEASPITAQARRMARQGLTGLPWRVLTAAGLLGRLARPEGSPTEQLERALSGRRPAHVEALMEWAAEALTPELTRAIELQAAVWADDLIREAEAIDTLELDDPELPTDLLIWSQARDDGASLRWIFWAAGRSTEALDAELRGLDESARPLLRGLLDTPTLEDDHLWAVAAAEPEAWWAQDLRLRPAAKAKAEPSVIDLVSLQRFSAPQRLPMAASSPDIDPTLDGELIPSGHPAMDLRLATSPRGVVYLALLSDAKLNLKGASVEVRSLRSGAHLPAFIEKPRLYVVRVPEPGEYVIAVDGFTRLLRVEEEL